MFAWLPSIAHALLEKHARCLTTQSHKGRDELVPKVQPCMQYQSQELFIVPWEVTEDMDVNVNGRDIQTRCPQALSKQAHINV